MKVLLVDDDRIALEMLERQLLGWGYEVVLARNGLDAWRAYQEDSFSFVISDWLMPEIDGLELVSKIRSSAVSHYVYCILLTVKSQTHDLVRGMDAGADDFLTKPFNPNELRVRLNAGKRIIELERKLSASNTRMERELKTAAAVQQSLLPVKLPQFEGAHVAWSYQPCYELGGDILNILPLSREKVALYLLDVAGKGVSAALLSVSLSRLLTTTANASSIVREKIDAEPGYRVVPPQEVLTLLNQKFFQDLNGETFFTMFYGVLDLENHQLCYASGGHNPAILLSPNGEVRMLESTGPLIGMLEDAEFEQVELTMKGLDRLLVYSDGITEAVNTAAEQFGVERFIQAAREFGANSVQEAVDRIIHRVDQWVQPNGPQDDVSCLVAEAS